MHVVLCSYLLLSIKQLKAYLEEKKGVYIFIIPCEALINCLNSHVYILSMRASFTECYVRIDNGPDCLLFTTLFMHSFAVFLEIITHLTKHKYKKKFKHKIIKIRALMFIKSAFCLNNLRILQPKICKNLVGHW